MTGADWWRLVTPGAGASGGAGGTGGDTRFTIPAAASGGVQSGAADDVEGYIRRAAAQRGIDPDTAIRVAQGEGGLVPNRTGSFKTGKSFWPFQLHYGGAGTPYASYGNVAGMGNAFTEKTGWQPGDPNAWQAATDYALDAAKQQGWGAWYGARNQGITGYQGISRGGGATPAAATTTPTTTPTSAPATGGAAPGWWSLVSAASDTPRGQSAPAVPARQTAAPGAPAAGSAGGGGDALGRQAVAAAWALSQIGSKDFYNLCQRFIEQAYGTGGRFTSAGAAGAALVKSADLSQADVGDLLFFRPDASNGYGGHAAIYLGNGEMVGATYNGVTRDNVLTSPYWKNLLVGVADPPAQWQGRAGTADLVKGAQQLVGNARAVVGNAAGAVGAAAASATDAPSWWSLVS